MNRLKEEINKFGTVLKQVKRTEKAAIYQQTVDGVEVGYEVIIIRIAPAGHRFNKDFPEVEIYPSSEDWGTYGWTYTSSQLAEHRYEEINKGLLRPNNNEKLPTVEINRPTPTVVKKMVSVKDPNVPKAVNTRVSKNKFFFEGKEYNSKSEYIKNFVKPDGSNKGELTEKLHITPQTVHAVWKNLYGNRVLTTPK